MRAHGRSPLTCYQYGAKLDELLRHLGDDTRLADVTLDQLEAWIARPRVGRGRGNLGSDATRNKDVLVVRGLWKWATAHGRLVHNPTVDLELPKVRNEDPRAIDVDTWSRFWTADLPPTERVAFGLGFFCGLRREEICRLEVGHVDLDSGMIVGFKRKGDRGKVTGRVPVVSSARLFAEKLPALLPSADQFLGPLEALLAARPGGWLLPWGEEALASPLRHRRSERPGPPDGMTCPDQINGRLKRRLERLGMPNAFTPHALRHSFVTYLLKAEVPLPTVSRLASHSTLNITMRYVRLSEDPLRELLTCEPLRGSRW